MLELEALRYVEGRRQVRDFSMEVRAVLGVSIAWLGLTEM